jgi:hypothetical protein
MPKYLLKASYNAEGVRGVMKDGGSKREAAARELVESLGGKVECFYFAHGDSDAIVICDFPDVPSALADGCQRVRPRHRLDDPAAQREASRRSRAEDREVSRAGTVTDWGSRHEGSKQWGFKALRA